MGRMNRERIQDYNERRRQQIERAVDTQAAQLKYKLMQTNGVPMPKVDVSVACPCSKWNFPHMHTEQERRAELARFERRVAALTHAEQHRFSTIQQSRYWRTA